MTSLEFLSFFFALSGRKGAAREHRREFSRGSITRAANDIMEALGDSSPQTTKGLKLATGLHAPRSRTEFDKAIAELQQRMYIVKVAEEYTPFSFVWAPLITVFPDQVREAQRIKAHHARRTILAKYFEIQLVATVRELRRLFDWPAPDIGHPLADLVKHGTLYEAVKVEGSTGSYYCHKKGYHEDKHSESRQGV